MAEMVSQFPGQCQGDFCMCVPAGVQVSLQAFQDQLCSAQGGETLTAVFHSGIYFDFNAGGITGIGGGAGQELPVFQQCNSDSPFAVGLVIRKLSDQILAPFFFPTKVEKRLVDEKANQI